MTPDTPSPWKDKRPPLKADSDSLDIATAEGIANTRKIVNAALATGAARWLTPSELADRAALPAPEPTPPQKRPYDYSKLR